MVSFKKAYKRKLRIAIVDNSTWNIYNFRLSLIKRLKAEGWEVIVIAPVDEYIHYLNDSHFNKHIELKNLSPQSRNVASDLLLVWELSSIYQKEQPDLIIHFTIKPNIFGNLAARLLGIPAIATITGLGYTFLHKGLINRLVPSFYKLAFQKTKRVIFYNPDDLELFINRKLIPAEKGTVIPGSGVNTNHFRPLPSPNEGKFIFLFIGRLLYDKGLGEFVEAARQLKELAIDAECWVIGGLNTKNPAAVSKKQLLEWVEEKHIRYFGEAADVRKYIKNTNVVVLPSYREGIPRSVLEGMAMGKPIITTNAAGCKETVLDFGNGFLVPSKDSKALLEAMLQSYQLSEENLRQMGEYSRKRALHLFDERIIVKQYLKVIRSICSLTKRTKEKPKAMSV